MKFMILSRRRPTPRVARETSETPWALETSHMEAMDVLTASTAWIAVPVIGPATTSEFENLQEAGTLAALGPHCVPRVLNLLSSITGSKISDIFCKQLQVGSFRWGCQPPYSTESEGLSLLCDSSHPFVCLAPAFSITFLAGIQKP